uniref:Uncharacterized protein n=1 Tax=Octopus bimaculoides TaxID=37653 RepID=A0A0L8G5M2_OCTBM
MSLSLINLTSVSSSSFFIDIIRFSFNSRSASFIPISLLDFSVFNFLFFIFFSSKLDS